MTEPVTMYNMPRVLLGLVPEAAYRIAEEAVRAMDVWLDDDELPPAPTPADKAQLGPEAATAMWETWNSAVQEVMVSYLTVGLGPYGIGAILSHIFFDALESNPQNLDLITRCCTFIEAALGGEEYAAEGVEMYVLDNLGSVLADLARPHAGPRYREQLKKYGYSP